MCVAVAACFVVKLLDVPQYLSQIKDVSYSLWLSTLVLMEPTVRAQALQE